ncbi:hypothetical protein HN615_08415 [Candidatus Woesearchaeota archaeon]|jgi:hypothetical protein|nr:hypothetical protein [Candidatus Woesearchaeota archaeon]
MENINPFKTIDMSKIEKDQSIYKGNLLDKDDNIIGLAPTKTYPSKEEYEKEMAEISKKKPPSNNGIPERGSQASKLLELINERDDIVIFRDAHGDPFVAFEIEGVRQVWPCRSKQFKQWLSLLYWNTYKTALPAEAKVSVIGTLEGSASFEKEIIPLHLRNSSSSDGSLWYDLTNDKWQAVKVTASGWGIVEKPPILFRRYAHNKEQVIPSRDGNIDLLFKYLNISEPDQKLLIITHIICSFIPDFAHPILLINGPQGSAKTTFSKTLRRIIDPSVIEVSSMPTNHKELIQIIAHNSFIFFDNISYVSNKTSDILCKAVTGSSFPKRELFSDDDDIIYTFKRGIGINGINMVAIQPDLLERSIILKLDRIDQTDRKLEKELDVEFEKDLPKILGGIFDVLVKALEIKPKVQQSKLPRMADFAQWGCAVSEAMSYTQKQFLDAYNQNIKIQTDVVINENLIASAIIGFMEERGSTEWCGTATKLLSELTTHANFNSIDINDKYWPKGSNILSRRLGELQVNLYEAGYEITTSGGGVRSLTIRRIDGALYMPPTPKKLDF